MLSEIFELKRPGLDAPDTHFVFMQNLVADITDFVEAAVSAQHQDDLFHPVDPGIVSPGTSDVPVGRLLVRFVPTIGGYVLKHSSTHLNDMSVSKAEIRLQVAHEFAIGL